VTADAVSATQSQLLPSTTSESIKLTLATRRMDAKKADNGGGGDYYHNCDKHAGKHTSSRGAAMISISHHN
jgi:hypothetical protein